MTKQVTYSRKPYAKTPRTCEVCNTSFQGTKKAKFCSNKCKQKNKNKRVKEGKDG